MADIRAVLSSNLKRLRELRGLSQERLALDSGVDRTMLSKIERRITNPSLNTLLKLAIQLRVELYELLQPSWARPQGWAKPISSPSPVQAPLPQPTLSPPLRLQEHPLEPEAGGGNVGPGVDSGTSSGTDSSTVSVTGSGTQSGAGEQDQDDPGHKPGPDKGGDPSR